MKRIVTSERLCCLLRLANDPLKDVPNDMKKVASFWNDGAKSQVIVLGGLIVPNRLKNTFAIDEDNVSFNENNIV